MKRLITCASLLLCGATAGASPPHVGDFSIFARLGANPGFPEGLAVQGNDVYVGGPATFGTAGLGPSGITVFRLNNGSPAGWWPLISENLSVEHAASCVATDAAGRAYLLSTQFGVVRYNAPTAQVVYAPIPNLPPSALGDRPPLPNDLAFAANGDLYVTDSLQPAIYRIRPGTGTAAVWFTDPRLDVPFGANGARVNPAGTHLYFTVSQDFNNVGYLYRLPLIAAPQASDLQTVATFAPNPGPQGPDGISFTTNGRVLVAMAGTNQVAELNVATGAEIRRFAGSGTDSQGSIPLDGPANFAWAGSGKVLITNHAGISGNAAHFAVLSLYLNESGAALNRPSVP